MMDEIRNDFGIAAWVDGDELKIAETEGDFYNLAWHIEQVRTLDVGFSRDHDKVRALAAFVRPLAELAA